MERRSCSSAELTRALVIKLRHHGDVLLSSPVCSTLKRFAPHCEVDVLLYRETTPLLSEHPAIDKIHCIDRGWKALSLPERLRREWRLLTDLRSRHFDLVVHLTDHPRGAWATRILRPRWAVAPIHDRRFWRHGFSHLFPTGNPKRHTVETNLDALRKLGIQPSEEDKRLHLIPGKAAVTRIDQLLRQHALKDNGFILLHPTSRWMFKAWTTANQAALIDALQVRGHEVVITAAPNQSEMKEVAAIMARCSSRPVDLSGQLNLRELAALISSARLFVGVDSAPMHMAAAVGTPVVALFGPTRDAEWHPWGVPHRVVVSDLHPCRPCGLDGCGGGKISECLVSIDCERVLTAIDDLLAHAPRHAAVLN